MVRVRLFVFVAAALLGLSIGPVDAADGVLPLPRFASLRSDKVNVRTGPGSQYPVEWVFQRKALPVEITAEFETWRKVRAQDGTEGWVQQGLLSGRRTAVVIGAVRPLRQNNDPQAGVVAAVEPGVVATLLSCHADWCRVEVDGQRGWLARSELWGIYPTETLE
jgi:SH3-like domain-containing protein